jgi:hypothetical protein
MKKSVLLLMVVLFSAWGVHAQEGSRADVSAGYSYLREGFSNGANTNGASFSGAGYFNDWLAVAGDFGVYHYSQAGVGVNTYTFLVGPRLTASHGSPISPFVQLLVGGDRLTVAGGSAKGFAWSTGGGVDLKLSTHMAFRPQFDYIGLRFSNGNVHSVRTSISLVYRF